MTESPEVATQKWTHLIVYFQGKNTTKQVKVRLTQVAKYIIVKGQYVYLKNLSEGGKA